MSIAEKKTTSHAVWKRDVKKERVRPNLFAICSQQNNITTIQLEELREYRYHLLRNLT